MSKRIAISSGGAKRVELSTKNFITPMAKKKKAKKAKKAKKRR